MKEEWKLIDDYKFKYFVNNFGVIKNQFNKILSPVLDKDGYLRIRFVTNSGKRKFNFVHRLVAKVFIDHPDFNKMTINHIDGNKINNNLNNLEIVTRGDNNRHAYRTGLKNNKGENHGKARFNELDILEIRRLYNEKNKNQTEIAKIYNTKQSRIWEIVNKITWKHI